MKAFIWAVGACLLISIVAGVVLIGMEPETPQSRVSSSVRLN